MLELLSGSYIRNANYVSVLKAKPPENPRYIDDCDLAVCLRWESRAPAAVDAKARDILKKLSEATEQLPHNTPGIVHIGFEAVWPAPGSEDTELGVLMEPEVGHGETEVYPRVQA
jgi:hypothetical protein